MTLDIIGVVITFLAVAVCAWFLGSYMVPVFSGGRVFLSPVLRPVERGWYWLIGVKEDEEQSWIRYAIAMLAVQVVSFLFTYLVLRLQDKLPLNPMGFSGVPADLTLNTAVSFTTNTNWQKLPGGANKVLPPQDPRLVIHNFLSAATGIAMAIALIRA